MKASITKTIQKIAIPIVSVLLALIIGIIIIELTGNNAFEAYGYMFKGAFGSGNSICELLTISVPLILCGLAITFAYKSGVLTIGVDGQLIMGAISAAWFVKTFANLPAPLITIGAIIVGMVVGALWGAIAGALKAFRKVNEIVSTLLMNYIALYLASYLYTYPLAATNSKIPQTEKVAEAVRLANLVPGTRVHIGIIIACSVNGALCGLAGAYLTTIYISSYVNGIVSGRGYIALAAVIFGKWKPKGVLLACIFFAFLDALQLRLQVVSNAIPYQFLQMLPYLATLIVLSFFMKPGSEPKANGKPYTRESR